MSQVIPGIHGTSWTWDKAVYSWLLGGTSQDVPGNSRDSWDIWDMGQGLGTSGTWDKDLGHLGHLTMLCSWLLVGTSQDIPGNLSNTWDIWDMGQGCVPGS